MQQVPRSGSRKRVKDIMRVVMPASEAQDAAESIQRLQERTGAGEMRRHACLCGSKTGTFLICKDRHCFVYATVSIKPQIEVQEAAGSAQRLQERTGEGHDMSWHACQ